LELVKYDNKRGLVDQHVGDVAMVLLRHPGEVVESQDGHVLTPVKLDLVECALVRLRSALIGRRDSMSTQTGSNAPCTL
jgi:hypothetical protein